MKAVVVGAGGHGRVVAAALRSRRGLSLTGFTDANRLSWGRTLDGVKVLGGDEKIGRPGSVAVYIGVGAPAETERRRRIYVELAEAGHKLPSLIATSAWVSEHAVLAPGCQILTHAVVHPGASVGENAVVNTGAVVEHDAHVGAHAFVSPGAIVLGAARLGDGVFLGAAAVVLPGVSVGARAVVAAGAVVIENVPPGARVAGVPARKMR